MQHILSYLQTHSIDIMFNAAAILICFLIARVLHARQSFAIAFGFLPVLVGWAFTNPSAKLALSGLF